MTSHGHIHPHGGTCSDPGCACHGHDHDHDHEHCHDHHSHHEAHSHAPISVTTHDSATIGSVQCTLALPYRAAVDEIQRRMGAVADRVTQAGGFIGHIKAIVEEDPRRCRISITDDGGADKKWLDAGASCRADCVCIVFGVTCQPLEQMLEAVFSDLIGSVPILF